MALKRPYVVALICYLAIAISSSSEI